MFALGSHLDACFGQIDFHSNLFARVNVRIVGLLEGTLQFFQLRRRECGADASLLTFFGQNGIVTAVDFVWQAGCVGVGRENGRRMD